MTPLQANNHLKHALRVAMHVSTHVPDFDFAPVAAILLKLPDIVDDLCGSRDVSQDLLDMAWRVIVAVLGGLPPPDRLVHMAAARNAEMVRMAEQASKTDLVRGKAMMVDVINHALGIMSRGRRMLPPAPIE